MKVECKKEISLPEFPEFRDLGLEDRFLLCPVFERLQPEISDRCFTNLFMWQPFYQIQLSQLNDNIILFASSETTPEDQFFFAPLGDSRMADTINTCFDFLRDNGKTPIVRRASEQFITHNAKELEQFNVEQDKDISDYIYRAEDLILLKGRHYNGQRNFINRFKKKYQYTVEDLTTDNREECKRFCQQWLDAKLKLFTERGMEESAFVFLKAEVSATQKVLDYMDVLNVKGMVVRINGTIAGITIGEMLNREMAVIHIEKCDHSYLGLSQFINQEFCRRYWSECRFINRMEDLGIESLRKAKIALRPHHMASKFNITVAS